MYKMVNHLASRLLMIFSIIFTLFFLDLWAQTGISTKVMELVDQPPEWCEVWLLRTNWAWLVPNHH